VWLDGPPRIPAQPGQAASASIPKVWGKGRCGFSLWNPPRQSISIMEGRDMKAANQPFPASQPANEQTPCYLAPAPVSEVLFDQLEYLLHHATEGCPPGCLDCGRLQQVKNWLLLPFRTAPIS